jgi:Tol biopolymer transport system component
MTCAAGVLLSAGSRALATVMVGLMVFSSCAGPEPKQSGGRETASASNAPVTPESSPHPFAGDSTWIAYQAQRGDREGVWLVHPDGTENHQIATDVAEQQLLPDWSPHGGQLVFTTRGGSTEPLYEYDLAKGESRQLFECADPCLGDDEPAYSPDGRKVAFVRALGPFVGDLPTDCGLWIGDRATRKVKQITANRKPPCDREYMPRWAPDGSQLVYWRQPDESGQSTTTAVFVIDANGRAERRLTKPDLVAGEPDWSPDGNWIVFATHPLHQFQCCEQSNLYRVHPDGSGMEPLTRLEGSEMRATQPRYSRDGKWILFTQVTPSSRTLSALPADGGQSVAITTSGIYTHGTWQPRS